MKSVALNPNYDMLQQSSESPILRAEKTESAAEVISRWKTMFKVPAEVKTPYPDGTMYLSSLNVRKLVA